MNSSSLSISMLSNSIIIIHTCRPVMGVYPASYGSVSPRGDYPHDRCKPPHEESRRMWDEEHDTGDFATHRYLKKSSLGVAETTQVQPGFNPSTISNTLAIRTYSSILGIWHHFEAQSRQSVSLDHQGNVGGKAITGPRSPISVHARNDLTYWL
jgi:hypothetical protein